jgi:putative SOS response-associated peptidase YedK
MCGRFTLTYPDAHLLAEELGVPVESLPNYAPHFNIAPTQEHFVVRIKTETREALPATWGLVNTWAKDGKRAAAQINARSETADRSGAFRDAFSRRRCVIPADGFYEWDRAGKVRQPYRFTRADGQLLLFAGLQESWQPEPGRWQRTFTILTTGPNAVVSPLHDRMPVVLTDRDADLWMFPTTPVPELKALLRPAPDDALVMAAVSTRVNKVDNDDRELIEPAEPVRRLAGM